MRQALLLPCVLLLALVAGCRSEPAAPPAAAVDALPILPIGGDFTLTNQDAQPFELASLRGKVVLVFFGYTMCPDACPTTLSKLSAAYARLTDDERGRVKAIYISIDPERDTPTVMKEHLTYFGVDAVGLTGTPEDTARVARQFGAHFERSSEPTAAGYLMSHTVSIFGLDARGQTRLLIDYEANVDTVVRSVRQLLAAA